MSHTPSPAVATDEVARAWPEQLAVRAAWCYYELGLTQQEVAARLGITRVRVNRLLAEARRRGVVRITINSELTENVELEEQLVSHFRLSRARVVLAVGEERALAEVIGRAAAQTLAPDLRDGWTIGIGWGITLKAFADAMPEQPLVDASVVAMLGSLTRRSSIDRFEATSTLAHRLNAECFYLPGPLICDCEESRATLLQQPSTREVRERARGAQIAIVSVGGLDSGTVRQAGLVSADEFQSVSRAGAIGNFLGHYVGAAAEVIDHPINRRVLGMRPEELRLIPRRIMISGGHSKVPALFAILNAGLLTELVTDQASARALINHP